MRYFVVLALVLGGVLTGTAVASSEGEVVFNRTPICHACHAIDTKKIGPSYREVAARYAGQEGAVQQLVNSIRNGSRGSWGPAPMTPNAALISEADATKLVEWILTLE